ncbi:MAG: hypothetical protein IID41_00265 [Planctomycetes bacterium]|nr:hypothetical protein [Planctomycetota bacterium]
MNKQFGLMASIGVLSAMIVATPGCSTPASQPAPSTPLPQGVFSTTDDCDIRTTSPSGGQTTEPQTLSIAFEINDRGVLIVLGEEIAVGRTVTLEGLQITYTRIEATANGVIIHSTLSGSVNNVSFSGTAIATLDTTEAGAIEYEITQTLLGSDGSLTNMGCTFILVP